MSDDLDENWFQDEELTLAEAKIERLRAIIMGVIAWIEQGGPPGLTPAEMVAELRRDLDRSLKA